MNLPTSHKAGHRFLFLSSPCSSEPPPMCLSLCAVWQQHFLVKGLVPTAKTSHRSAGICSAREWGLCEGESSFEIQIDMVVHLCPDGKHPSCDPKIIVQPPSDGRHQSQGLRWRNKGGQPCPVRGPLPSGLPMGAEHLGLSKTQSWPTCHCAPHQLVTCQHIPSPWGSSRVPHLLLRWVPTLLLLFILSLLS